MVVVATYFLQVWHGDDAPFWDDICYFATPSERSVVPLFNILPIRSFTYIVTHYQAFQQGEPVISMHPVFTVPFFELMEEMSEHTTVSVFQLTAWAHRDTIIRLGYAMRVANYLSSHYPYTFRVVNALDKYRLETQFITSIYQDRFAHYRGIQSVLDAVAMQLRSKLDK
jgi:hypothetical protein